MMSYPPPEWESTWLPTDLLARGWCWSCTASCEVSLTFRMSRLMSRLMSPPKMGPKWNILLQIQYCVILNDLMSYWPVLPQARCAVVSTTERSQSDPTGTGCPCTGWPWGCTPVGLKNKETFGQWLVFFIIFIWTENALFIITQTHLGQCDKWSLNTQSSCLVFCYCFQINRLGLLLLPWWMSYFFW